MPKVTAEACPAGDRIPGYKRANEMPESELRRRTRAFGLCSESESDEWYPPEPASADAMAWAAYEDYAEELCAPCPVRAECLALALAYEARAEGEQPVGIWGGTSPRQRELILRRPRPADDLEVAS